MAPALTEPLSPTEKLTSSAVTATATPTTRSSRKLEPIGNKSNNINTATTNVLKATQPIREKRNRSGGQTQVNQTPTSSKRITRSRDSQHRNPSETPSPASNETKEENQNTTPRRISKGSSQGAGGGNINTTTINNNSSSTKNEQMGLSTAPLNSKNKILNNNNNNNNNTNNLDTVDSNTKDTSTAQLLADLTNEAITAEICLRNQLKDVNLVKTGGGEPSSPIQQDTSSFVVDDIVLKSSASPATATSDTKSSTAHMEAQSNESSKTSQAQKTSDEEEQKVGSTSTVEEKTEEESTVLANNENEILQEIKHDDDKENKTEAEKSSSSSSLSCTTETVVHESEHNTTDLVPVHETSDGLPDTEEADAAKKSTTNTSKIEIVSVQELPPISTDSTMTASEVEDNIEERLSQLDGTAIDSPPPNHDIDVDSNGKTNRNSVAAATPPRTPTHQQTLTEDIQQLQEQLQNTPPTPVAQQVQAHHHMQQQNCFTPQSTTSSVNTLGSGNIPQSFIKETEGGGAELEDQDIEEVFKVLKGFEGGTTSDLNVCDLNVLFNEVYMKINETETESGNAAVGGIAVGGVGGGGGSNQSHVTVANPSIQLVKPTEIEEGQIEIEKRQQQMQRKIDFLTRRLRKLQARYMCKHTSEEIAGLFEWSARQSSKGITHHHHHHHNTTPLPINEPHTSSSEILAQDPTKYFLKVIAARPPATDWKDFQDSLVPATQITTLLRKIESVANAQQLCITPSASLVNMTNKKSKKALLEAQAAAAAASSSMASSEAEGRAEEIVVPTLEENVTDELTQVTGLLQSEMSEVQRAIDSDATESSSGGESADEMVTYNNTQQQTLPITKRAAWRYSRDRAAIASRWSWLLSQISDLEIKIRQHSELHQEIVRSKGPVTCGPIADDGLKMDVNVTSEQDDEEQMGGSCRTRGFIPSQFRKRKLIQTTNIHTISKKAARPSTIKCGCQWPIHPCALCTGRLDPTAPRDLPDTMMMSDRIGLLDSGYHPVLSFRENVNNALHFEAIAKLPEWQQRVMRCQAKNIAKNVWRAEREAVAAAAGGHHSSSSKKYSSEAPPAKRRYIKKKDRINIEEKSGGGGGSGKNTNSTTTTGGTKQNNAATTSAAAASAQFNTSSSTISLNDTGNGTASLSTTSTTSTTPLVANKGMAKNVKKQNCLILEDRILKEPVNLLPPPCLTTATTTTIPQNTAFIHQTSECRLPINYDQYNPNQIPSSLISSNNNSSSKSNKHRKLSSSTVVNSHNYNHHNNINHHQLYNGESNYILNNDTWSGGAGGENFPVRSRNSSPTHGSSGSNYHKYERSLDRKNRTSYDIDNIVIPYSVAAATRVEILPYKEIPTPKWRVIESEIEECKKLEISESKISTDATDSKPSTNGNFCDTTDSIKKDLKEDEKSAKEESNEKVINDSKDIDLKKEENCSDKKSEVELSKTTEKTSPNSSSIDDDVVKDEKLKISSSTIGKEVEAREETKLKDITTTPCNKDLVNDEPEPKKPKVELSVNCDLKLEDVEEGKMLLQKSLNASTEEDEDISDDSMFLRHEKALTEERRKFQTYLKFPWSTRSRANRRIDSRAESSGANTPDPSSPAPQTPSVGGGDLESIPSPLNPSTPLNPLDTISEAGDNSTSFLGVGAMTSLSSKHYERRRTTSTKRDRELERRSSTPDSKELIPPYDSLKFPLTEEQFDELLRAMPNDHSEDSKRFDDCYLPGGIGAGTGSSTKYPRTISSSTSKRTSRASTMCGDTTAGGFAGGGGGGSGSGGRRARGSLKNMRPISADDSMNVSSLPLENGDMLLYDEDYDDDYPKHHLAPNDDHLTADSGCGVTTAGIGSSGVYDDDDIYGDQYGAYVGGRQQRKHRDSDGETTEEEEPFQDDDPNDPEWRGETEERFRKKV